MARYKTNLKNIFVAVCTSVIKMVHFSFELYEATERDLPGLETHFFHVVLDGKNIFNTVLITN